MLDHRMRCFCIVTDHVWLLTWDQVYYYFRPDNGPDDTLMLQIQTQQNLNTERRHSFFSVRLLILICEVIDILVE